MPLVGHVLFNKMHLSEALEESFSKAAEYALSLPKKFRTTDLKLAREIAYEAKMDPLCLGKATSPWVRDDQGEWGRIPKHEVTHLLVSVSFRHSGDMELWHWLPRGCKPRQVTATVTPWELTITARAPLGCEDAAEEELLEALEFLREAVTAQHEQVERYNAGLLEKAKLWVQQRKRTMEKRNAIEARLAKLSFN